MSNQPARLDRVPIIVAALAVGKTERDAAAAAGCTPRTVRRVKAEHGQQIDAARADHAERVAHLLTGESAAAAARLARVIADSTDREAQGRGVDRIVG